MINVEGMTDEIVTTCSPKCNNEPSHGLLADAKSTERRIAGEQDFTPTPRIAPQITYLLIIRGGLCIYKGEIEQLPQ